MTAGSRTVMQTKYLNPLQEQSTQTGENQLQYYEQELLHERSGHTFTHPVLQWLPFLKPKFSALRPTPPSRFLTGQFFSTWSIPFATFFVKTATFHIDSSTLKMEAACTFETVLPTYQSARYHNPEGLYMKWSPSVVTIEQRMQIYRCMGEIPIFITLEEEICTLKVWLPGRHKEIKPSPCSSCFALTRYKAVSPMPYNDVQRAYVQMTLHISAVKVLWHEYTKLGPTSRHCCRHVVFHASSHLYRLINFKITVYQ